MKRHLLLFSVTLLLFTACEDKWEKYEDSPDFLGANIYDYLQKRGDFDNYVRLIDDLDYTAVLSKTGSKTLFVADDEAFERFFANNPWGVRSYEELTLAQKKLLLNSAMINNAFLVENLSAIEGPVRGQALRRATALSVMDTVTWEQGSDLPANKYWDRFRSSGLALAKDDTPIPIFHFTQASKTAKGITDDDFRVLFNGKQWVREDAYIYDIKVKEADIICQNGYIHVLEDVLIPPSNMAETVRLAPETSTFSSFLERYAAPYYSRDLTSRYQSLGYADSVFVKHYFAARGSIGGDALFGPDELAVASSLNYDPGWNRYFASESGGNFQTDMAVIFAPSNEAFEEYFNTGAGVPLIERYGSVENIPDNVLESLVRNLMKPSFLGALPSLFPTIVDDAREPMGITKDDIEKVYLTSNGIVYVTNKVYVPALYSSVMFPATINENLKVFDWAIKQLGFDAYLLSMVSYYSFIIPKDDFVYIPPVFLKWDRPFALKFRYDNKNNTVYASEHAYDTETHQVSPDSIGVMSSSTYLLNYLEDMLNYHIIVGNIEDGKEYYRTKGGGSVRVQHTDGNIRLFGGGDIERGVNGLLVGDIYDQTAETNGRGNGKTYVVEQPVQAATTSVYGILSDAGKYPQFSEFFKLADGNADLWPSGADPDPENRAKRFNIFDPAPTQAGLDFNVLFLNTYHYTLYVPSNEAVLDAISRGLPTWEQVEAETDQEKRDALAEKIVRFVRYHFQDNAVYVEKESNVNASYETATLNTETSTFYRVYLKAENENMTVRTELTRTETDDNKVARVVTEGGAFNIMARDYKFDAKSAAAATKIETSSFIVIHQIDKCLYFNENQLQ